jgi:DNA-binding IclR family transcriptional regulator
VDDAADHVGVAGVDHAPRVLRRDAAVVADDRDHVRHVVPALDQAAGSSALQSHNWVGQRIPLHATSNGKILLSELSDAELAAALPHLPHYTDHTITSRSELVEQLAEVRRLGYAVAVDELEMGLTAAAAPIRSAHGDIIASMSISGPTFRLTRDRLDETVPMVVEAALEVSHRLGWGRRG